MCNFKIVSLLIKCNIKAMTKVLLLCKDSSRFGKNHYTKFCDLRAYYCLNEL